MWAWLKGGVGSSAAKTAVESSPMRTYSAQAARQKDGARAESVAQQHLLEHGLKLVNANVACAQGEIDLIMLDGETLVFVEVRWRKSQAYGGAAVSVTPHKLAKLMRACEMFLQHEPVWRQYPCRVDVLALQGDLNAPTIEWLKNVTV
jgi:putative endonuclease